MMNFKILLALVASVFAGAAATRYVNGDGLNLKGQASLPTSATGYYSVGVKSADGLLWVKNSSGTEYNVTSKAYVDGAVSGGAALTVNTYTGNQTISSSNDVIVFNCTSLPCNSTMPSVAATTIKPYRFFNKGSVPVTFVRDSSDTFNNDTTLELGVDQINWPSFTAIPDGSTTWLIGN